RRRAAARSRRGVLEVIDVSEASAGPSAQSVEVARVPQREGGVQFYFDEVFLHLHPDERVVAVLVGRILGDSILEGRGGEGRASGDPGDRYIDEEREPGGRPRAAGEGELGA